MRYYLTPLLILIAQVVLASNDNIVIASSNEIYKIEASKDGASLSKVKAHKEIVYEATRMAGNALALEFYDDYVKIDKASASGAKAQYRHWIPEDIFYTDSKVCYLDIPLKEKGKTVKAVFDKTYIRADHFTEVLFPEIYDMKSKVVRIEVPQSLVNRVRIVEKSFTPNIVRKVEEGKKGERIYVYEITDMPAPEKEEDSPDASVTMPRIHIIGQYQTVGELYKYLHGLTIDPDSALESVKAQAMEIVDGCTDDKEKINKLVEWVQNRIRYIAVEHGEYGTRPDLASEVLRKRYGDCKGMSALLKSMLIAVGFDARLVWIGTDDVGAIWSEVPSLSSGNHMICAVVEGDSILYIDGTATYLPVGVYSPSIQGREALIEDGENYMLKNVPIMSPDVNKDKLTATYEIDKNALVGVAKRELEGVDKMILCGAYHSVNATNKIDLLSKYICYPKKNVVVDDVKITGDAEQAFKTILTAKVMENDACQSLSGKLYIDIQPLRQINIATYDIKKRKNDILLSYCNSTISEISIKIPSDYQVGSLPATYEVENKWFSASIAYEVIGDEIKCKSHVVIKERLIELDDAKQWNKLARELKQANSEQIVLIHK